MSEDYFEPLQTIFMILYVQSRQLLYKKRPIFVQKAYTGKILLLDFSKTAR